MPRVSLSDCTGIDLIWEPVPQVSAAREEMQVLTFHPPHLGG